MNTTCKWLSTGVFVAVFACLIWVSGCLHIIELFASIAAGFIVARAFYLRACGAYTRYPLYGA